MLSRLRPALHRVGSSRWRSACRAVPPAGSSPSRLSEGGSRVASAIPSAWDGTGPFYLRADTTSHMARCNRSAPAAGWSGSNSANSVCQPNRHVTSLSPVFVPSTVYLAPVNSLQPAQSSSSFVLTASRTVDGSAGSAGAEVTVTADPPAAAVAVQVVAVHGVVVKSHASPVPASAGVGLRRVRHGTGSCARVADPVTRRRRRRRAGRDGADPPVLGPRRPRGPRGSRGGPRERNTFSGAPGAVLRRLPISRSRRLVRHRVAARCPSSLRPCPCCRPRARRAVVRGSSTMTLAGSPSRASLAHVQSPLRRALLALAQRRGRRPRRGSESATGSPPGRRAPQRCEAVGAVDRHVGGR